MWSKKLLPASQSVIMFVNRIEFASIPFPDRFPPAVSYSHTPKFVQGVSRS